MKRLVRFVMAASALALLPAGLYAQGDGTISGTVVEQNTQQPVQGAQVVVVGTQRGAMTDDQGRYSITGVPAGTYDLRARRVGYTPLVRRVTLGAGMTETVDFGLTAAATTLDEVIVNAVTGQEQRRLEVGVNTGNVNVADLNKGPITKFTDVLQGRVPGVMVQSAVGTTGGSQRIRIRGANSLSLSNEPLYYIDGVLASNSRGGFALGGQDYSRVSDINPDEVENIEILKGPAASALYGSAAANGVILITTKKGRPGRTVWRVYAEGAQMKDENDWPLNYAALTDLNPNAVDDFYHIDFGGVLNIGSIGVPNAPYEICPNYRAGIAAGDTVSGQVRCSQDVLLSFDQFRDPRTTMFETGARAKVGLNVSGGSEGLTYFLSGDREKESGVLRPNDLQRTSVRANIQARLGSKANAGVTATYIQSNTERISNDNSVFSPLINAFLGTAQYLPGMESDTVGSPGGRLGSYFGYHTNDQRLVKALQDIDRFMIGSNINFTPLSWLRLNGNGGLDYFGRFDQFSMDPNILPLAESYLLGFRNAERASNYLWTAHGSGTATFSFTPAIVSNTTLGASYQRGLFRSNFCYGEGIPSGTRSCAATTSKFAVDEDQTDQITVGVFARQELALNDRLFVAGSIRGDNNSGLTQEEGLTYYPSVNASWVLSSEPFFPTLGWLSQLRLRAGWGTAGQRPGFGDAETFFTSVAVQSGSIELPALILNRTGNRRLKVERTTELEGGLDVGFLEDRITADFTAFQRVARDALISRQLPPSGGVTATVFQNLGRIKNWGTEWGLGATGFQTGPVRFNARFTATTLKNRIEALGEGIAPITFNRGRQAHRENFPTGAFFALPIKYRDADGNGLLTREEVSVDSSKFLVVRDAQGNLDTLNTSYVGPQLPTNTQTVNLDVTLFNSVTLSTLFERRAGHKQLNETEFFRCRQQAGLAFHSQCGALSNPNASLEEQAAFIGAQFFSATPYGYIQDADFVKWRELSLRFTVPESVGSRWQALSGASITVSGRNLATWTDYWGLDPEINETGGGSNFTQGEFNTQPQVRVYSIRLDFQLR